MIHFQLNGLHHVCHHHVDQIHAVKWSAEVRCAHVLRISSVYHQIVVQNVSSMPNVRVNRLVFVNGARIHVLARVDLKPNVMCSIICQFVHAMKIIWVIHSFNVLQKQSSRSHHCQEIRVIHHHVDQMPNVSMVNAIALMNIKEIRTKAVAQNVQQMLNVVAIQLACAVNA